MSFTTVMTTVSDVNGSVILAFDQAFLVAVGQDANLDQVVTVRKNIGAKSIQFPKYSRLAISTTPLTEDADPASAALGDAAIVLTPAEYGAVVTTTKLANLQTNGTVDIAAATLVGMNVGMTQDKLICTTLDTIASGQTFTPSGSAISALSATTDICTRGFVNKMFNKLARSSVPKLEGGAYIMVAHDDVISDLRNDAQAGSWTDVSKYADPTFVLANEVGMIAGFRVIRNNQATIQVNVNGFVDGYNNYFMGMNALGKAVSRDPGLTITGPFDKLGRFVNVGWYGVMKYALVDTDASYLGVTSSTFGNNAS